MFEVIFLISLATIWMIFAVVQDLKKREIANWLNFSLIIFTLGFRFFYSLFIENFQFFFQGFIGLAIFFSIGNILYYSRFFAGGDAKLMISLGAILPFFDNFKDNLNLLLLFFLIFLFSGAGYAIFSGIYLSLKNSKKFINEFKNQKNKNKKIIYATLSLSIPIMALGLIQDIFLFLGILMAISPYVFFYAKSIDESCMVKKIKTSRLTEGDWLYKDVRIGKRTIRAKWDGLTNYEINQIRKKYNFIKIKQGIPFSPVFLISFFVFLYLLQKGLWQILEFLNF